MAEDLMPISAEVGLVMYTTLESEDDRPKKSVKTTKTEST